MYYLSCPDCAQDYYNLVHLFFENIKIQTNFKINLSITWLTDFCET